MDLYLMRHGSALDVGTHGIQTDAARPLSADGRRKTREVARGLAALDTRLAAIASSPLVRAVETARIVQEVLCPEVEPALCAHLRPGGSAADLIGWLSDYVDRPILLVGHLPDLSDIASALLSGHPGLAIEFHKAGVACFTCDGPPCPGRAQLQWLLEPGHLRALGR